MVHIMVSFLVSEYANTLATELQLAVHMVVCRNYANNLFRTG